MSMTARTKQAISIMVIILVVGAILAPAAGATHVIDWSSWSDYSNSQAAMYVRAGVDYNHPGANYWRAIGEQSGNDYNSGEPPNFWQLKVSVEKWWKSSCASGWTKAGAWSNTLMTASWNQKITPETVNITGSCLKRWSLTTGEFWTWPGPMYSGSASIQT